MSDISINAKVCIDELICSLDKKFEQGHWDEWTGYLKEVLTSQFEGYESTAAGITKRLRKKFENWSHLIFPDLRSWKNVERSTASEEGIKNIIEEILPRFYFNAYGLEESIDSLNNNIKLGSLSNRERKSLKEIFKNHVDLVSSAAYSHSINFLKDYYPLLASYLINLEELNRKAEDIGSHLEKREWFSYWFSGRQARKVWTEGFRLLLKNLEDIYPKLVDSYSKLNQKVRDHHENFRKELKSFQEVPKLKEIYERLIAKDPNPEITIDRQQDEHDLAIYKITMQATNKGYVMDNPRLKLVGWYRNANSKELTEINLDLTGDKKIHFCAFEFDKNEQRIEVNLKIAKVLYYPSLKLVGIYELPYIKEEKQKEATLTKIELI